MRNVITLNNFTYYSTVLTSSKKIPPGKIPAHQTPPGKILPPKIPTQKIPNWNIPTHFVKCLSSLFLQLILCP